MDLGASLQSRATDMLCLLGGDLACASALGAEYAVEMVWDASV